jgi:predicted ATPase/serine/threonine protein kinase
VVPAEHRDGSGSATEGTNERADEADDAPEQIGRFAVRGKLGQGGMGVVFLGHDSELERKIAIKLLRSTTREKIGALRLVREAQGLARLSHPNVIQVHEIGEHDGSMFVAMEYVDGSTLRDWLDSQPRSWRETLDMLRQAGRGLEAAHLAGLVHRDFKPRNVMVGSDRRVRVLDFGLVRDAGTFEVESSQSQPNAAQSNESFGDTLGDSSVADTDVAALTRSGTLIGTPAYMAPEQMQGQPCNALSDQFSFCVAVYESLFGRRPFLGGTLGELLANVCGGVIEQISSDSDVPLRVQQAVLRGLAVEPHRRWPSMTALLEELDAVVMMVELQSYLERLRGTSPLLEGQLGVEQKFQVVEGLYGRGSELDALVAAFERTRGGSPTQFVLISGPTGVGKSSLVDGLRPIVEQQAGLMCAGKFEAQRTTPLSAMIEALEDLVVRFECIDGSRQLELRRKLVDAVGRNAPLLLEFVPAVARLLGQSHAAQDRPNSSEGLATVSPERLNRLHIVVERLVVALASPQRPLVMFVDDLQWADNASLALLQHLLSNHEPNALLVVGTCRSNEVTAAHPVRKMLDHLASVGSSITHVELEALSLADIEALLADSLARDRSRVRELAKLVLGKTEGNPFHLRQLLRTIYDEGLFEYDAEAHGWHWDIERVASCRALDDIGEVLLRNLARLHPAALRLVQIAACMGDRVELQALAAAAQLEPMLAFTDLWPALERGVLFIERGMLDGAPAGESSVLAFEGGSVTLRFRHVRLQQAALDSLNPSARARTHLQIGRTIRRRLDGDEQSARVFEVARQLNAGRALLEADERWDLAKLNYRCGRLAFETAAFSLAIEHFGVTIALLPTDAVVHRREFWFAATLDLARALTLDGRYAEAERGYLELLDYVETDMEQLSINTAQVEHALLLTDYEGGFAACRRGFARLGIVLPERDEDMREMFVTEIEAIATNLAGRSPASIAALPDIDDHEIFPAPKLFHGFALLSYFAGHRNLNGWINAWMTNIALRSGNSKVSTVAYGRIASYLAERGDHDLAQSLGELTISLCRRYDDPSTSGRALLAYFGFAAYYDYPLAQLIPQFSSAHVKCRESGELLYAAYQLTHLQHYRLAAGVALPEIMAEIEAHLPFLRRSVPSMLANYYVPLIIFVVCEIMDISLARLGVKFDHEAYVASCGWSHYLMGWYYSVLAKLDYLLGRRPEVSEILRQAGIAESGASATLYVRESHFYLTLSLLDPARPQPLDASLREYIDIWRADLARCAARCPSNFGHMLALVDAEIARAQGEPLDAIVSRYEQAIDEARLHGVSDQEALACWRFAEFWATRGSKRTALVYLETARDLYEAWGAVRLVRVLDARRDELLPPRPRLGDR